MPAFSAGRFAGTRIKTFAAARQVTSPELTHARGCSLGEPSFHSNRAGQSVSRGHATSANFVANQPRKNWGAAAPLNRASAVATAK
jgi:hypothetical protein